MNKIILRPYSIVATKLLTKGSEESMFLHAHKSPMSRSAGSYHPTKIPLFLIHIMQSYRIYLAQASHVVPFAVYKPHRRPDRPHPATGRNRKAVSFFEFNP